MSLILLYKMFITIKLMNVKFTNFYMKTDGTADLIKITGILFQVWLPKNLNKSVSYRDLFVRKRVLARRSIVFLIKFYICI
jgi:hypothetical protein